MAQGDLVLESDWEVEIFEISQRLYLHLGKDVHDPEPMKRMYDFQCRENMYIERDNPCFAEERIVKKAIRKLNEAKEEFPEYEAKINCTILALQRLMK